MPEIGRFPARRPAGRVSRECSGAAAPRVVQHQSIRHANQGPAAWHIGNCIWSIITVCINSIAIHARDPRSAHAYPVLVEASDGSQASGGSFDRASGTSMKQPWNRRDAPLDISRGIFSLVTLSQQRKLCARSRADHAREPWNSSGHSCMHVAVHRCTTAQTGSRPRLLEMLLLSFQFMAMFTAVHQALHSIHFAMDSTIRLLIP
jgi:hypothetical protein